MRLRREFQPESAGQTSGIYRRSRVLTTPALLAALLGIAGSAHAQGLDVLRTLTAGSRSQGRIMWIDGSANVTRTVHNASGDVVTDYTTTSEGVNAIVQHCKAAHINTLVVDIKPLSGQVLYDSHVAPHMRMWKGHPVPDFDVLAAFIKAGHAAGLQVDASINILSEGHKYFSVGLAYEHPDWQSIVYTVDRGLNADDGARLPVHSPGEPDDPAKPALLSDESTLLGEPVSGMVGLEKTDNPFGIVQGGANVGKQLNVTLDANNRITGMLDSALLGDEPLAAPEEGHLLTAVRAQDRAWVSQHLHVGSQVRFDMHTAMLPITKAPSEKVSCFVNPLNPEVRKHELDMVREIVTNYDVDGLVLDRCRYSNLYNDFSDLTRNAFARWLGRTITRWPEDVFAFPQLSGEKPVQGPLYRPWLEFRAQVIRDFVADVAGIVRSVKPRIAFGTYVGSWYPSYYEVGVNWGSEYTHLRYSWFTPTYPRTGYAEFFDWISTGCYYPVATVEDARRQGLSEQATVEYAAQLSNEAVQSGALVYPGVNVPDYETKPEQLLSALAAAGKNGQGWMIFDISYIDTYNWWPYLERAYPTEAVPPTSLTELLTAARSARDAAE